MHVKKYEESLMLYDEYRIHKILLLYLPPTIVILGTFGNVFSFIILRRKTMIKFSTYFYLAVLAVADTLVLYIGLLRLWIGELTGYDLKEQADWLCKLTNVLGYTVSDYSVWLIIAVTVERYIVVCHPLKANTLCNNQRAKKVIVILLVAMAALNIHFIWTASITTFTLDGEKIPRCTGAKEHKILVEDVWPWVDAFTYSFLPFLIIIVLNSLIIRQVIHARRSRSQLSGSIYEQRRPSSEGSTKLTVMLLTISFSFVLTTLPMNMSLIASVLIDPNTDLQSLSKFKLVKTITELLMYVNHSMNFFLYCATGHKFRRQLIWMVCYDKRTYHISWGSENSQSRMDLFRNSVAFSKSTRRSLDTTEKYSCNKHDILALCPPIRKKEITGAKI